MISPATLSADPLGANGGLLRTLTLNPALDLSTTTDKVEPTHKLRCGPVQRFAGGGGINVARVLHRLGAPVQAVLLAGGAAGAQVAALLAQAGVPHRVLAIAGDTRENLSVVEPATGLEYRFVLPGPTVQLAEWQSALAAAVDTPSGQAPGWLVASGSLPPGVPDDFYARLARQAGGAGWRFVLDTSGPALQAALAAGVTLVKPSLRELREATGLPLADARSWCEAAQALVRQGQAQVVALSVGEQGAVLATADGVWQAPALAVPAATGTTGAGDCFLAALVWALGRGEAPADALRWAVAAGAAALEGSGTTLAQAEAVRRLVQSVPAPQRCDQAC